MNFTLVELQRIKLEPGEVLTVKLYGDDYEQEEVATLKEHLKTIFPNNVVAMFVLPNGNDIQMEAVKGSEIKENTELGCSTDKFCVNCSCGKKEAAEG